MFSHQFSFLKMTINKEQLQKYKGGGSKKMMMSPYNPKSLSQRHVLESDKASRTPLMLETRILVV